MSDVHHFCKIRQGPNRKTKAQAYDSYRSYEPQGTRKRIAPGSEEYSGAYGNMRDNSVQVWQTA